MINEIKNFIKVNLAQHYWNSKKSFTYCGQKVFFPKNNAIFKRTVTSGIFEGENLKIIFSLIKADTEVFDIGANIGIMLIPVLRFDQTVTLVAIEASPNNIPYLRKTYEHNPYKNRWTIIDKAVFDYEGKISFQLASAENGAYDSIYDNKRIGFERTVELDCTTIDIIWNNRNKPTVSFIKIDIEGAELVALRGGINCITECQPSILMEWNQNNIAPFKVINKDLYDFVQSINYLIYAAPSLNRITSLTDLELQSKFTENFLLVPNEQ